MKVTDVNVSKVRTISDQDAITIASNYDITNYGNTPEHITSIDVPQVDGTIVTIENPTQEQINQLAEQTLTGLFGDLYSIVPGAEIHDAVTGLDGIVIINNETGETFAVFQGSQMTYGAIDWHATNLALGNNEIHPQHLAALEQIAIWKEQYNITGVSGNSLVIILVQVSQ